MYIDRCSAITKAIEDVTGVKVGIKWPNDILYEGKKLVVFQTEMNAEMDCVRNTSLLVWELMSILIKKKCLKKFKISLLLCSKLHKFSHLKLLNKILYYLEHCYIICQEEGFAPILDEWRKYSITLNQHIRVIGTNEVLEGIAVDIDDDGVSCKY